MNIFSLEKLLIYVGFYSFQSKEETNRDYSFPAGLEDHILGENVSPNMSISGLVPGELSQSNTSLGSSGSSGDVGRLQFSTGMGRVSSLVSCTVPSHPLMPCLLRWSDRFLIQPFHSITVNLYGIQVLQSPTEFIFSCVYLCIISLILKL